MTLREVLIIVSVCPYSSSSIFYAPIALNELNLFVSINLISNALLIYLYKPSVVFLDLRRNFSFAIYSSSCWCLHSLNSSMSFSLNLSLVPRGLSIIVPFEPYPPWPACYLPHSCVGSLSRSRSYSSLSKLMIYLPFSYLFSRTTVSILSVSSCNRPIN